MHCALVLQPVFSSAGILPALARKRSRDGGATRFNPCPTLMGWNLDTLHKLSTSSCFLSRMGIQWFGGVHGSRTTDHGPPFAKAQGKRTAGHGTPFANAQGKRVTLCRPT